MRNTIRKVMMVVEVLITSCQVSLYWKNGPESSHTTIRVQARMNAQGRPVARDVALAQRVNTECDFVGRTGPPIRLAAKGEVDGPHQAHARPQEVQRHGLLHVEDGKGHEDGQGDHFLQDLELRQLQ